MQICIMKLWSLNKNCKRDKVHDTRMAAVIYDTGYFNGNSFIINSQRCVRLDDVVLGTLIESANGRTVMVSMEAAWEVECKEETAAVEAMPEG